MALHVYIILHKFSTKNKLLVDFDVDKECASYSTAILSAPTLVKYVNFHHSCTTLILFYIHTCNSTNILIHGTSTTPNE